MAIGDAASAVGYSLVPETGSDDARVRWGAREFNRTRDYIARVKALIKSVWAITDGGTGATTKSGARTNLGITSGTGYPTGGANGDIYFRIV